MKSFILVFSIFLLVNFSTSFSEIKGPVSKGQTGEPIEAVNITIKELGVGSSSDKWGRFNLLIEETGTFKLSASAMGFENEVIKITTNDSKDIFIDFSLTPSVVELNPVTILKERTSVLDGSSNFLRIPGSAGVVSSKDIARFNDSDVNKMLAQIPGVYIQEEDGYGLRPNIGMRGTGVERSSKINMMEDGILISPAPYASPAAYYSPTAGRMESLEVRKGSSQIKYGPNTSGGALNYVSTSIPDKFTVKTNLMGGQFRTSKAYVNVGSSGEWYGYLLETYLDNTSGFKELPGNENTGYEKKDYLAKFRLNTPASFFIPAAVELKLSRTNELSNETYLGLTRDDFETNPQMRYAASAMDKMNAKHEQMTLTAVIQPLTNLNITTAIYNNNFHRNWYKLDKVDGVNIADLLADPESNSQAYHQLDASENGIDIFDLKANNRSYNATGVQFISNVKISHGWFNHHFMGGFRYHVDEMDRFQKVDKYGIDNSEFVLTTEGVWGTGSKNNRLYEADASSFFIEDELEIGNTTVTMGIRSENIHVKRTDWKENDWNDPERAGNATVKEADFNVIVPGIGVVYKMKQNLSLIAGLHKGFTPPGPGTEENTAVPEESINMETGFRYKRGFTHFELFGFNNMYNNLLGDDTQFAGEGTYEQYNAGEVNIHGLEFTASRTIFLKKVTVPFHFSYTYTKTKFLNSFESEYEPWGDVKEGYELPYIPHHQWYFMTGLEMGKMKIFVRSKFVNAVRIVAGDEPLNETNSTDPIALIDLSGEYKLTNHSHLFITVNNVTNSHAVVSMRPSGLRPTMPRMVIGGLKITF